MSLHSASDASNDINPQPVHMRIQRGARAIGTDGDLGSVEQIVVDQATGEVRALVVQRPDDGTSFELPIDIVTRATSDEVQIDLASADLDRRPDVARPYNPDDYVAMQPDNTAPRVRATSIAQDTDHPVVTNVESDAADLVATPNARLAANATAERATSRSPSQSITADADEGSADTLLRHDASRADIGEETVTSAPPRGESVTPSVTGELIGGKPTTGGMGDSSAVPGSNMPTPELDAQPEFADLQATPPRENDDLADLTDDELSNPDAALVNPPPGAKERISRPFNESAPSPEDISIQRSDADRAGMESAFRTATNSSADDTHIVRDPALRAASATNLRSTRDTSKMPTADAKPHVEDQSAHDVTLPTDSMGDSKVSPPTTIDSPVIRVATIAGAFVAVGLASRLYAGRRALAFAPGMLVGGTLALVLAPMSGAHLRARLADAVNRRLH